MAKSCGRDSPPRERRIPFLAGSSLPVTWRMPAVDLPFGAAVEEAMGGVDSYDFHAPEVIQCMTERHKGGETGVVALQALRGDPVWAAMAAGTWKAGGWDPTLFEARLCRSHPRGRKSPQIVVAERRQVGSGWAAARRSPVAVASIR